MSTAPHQTILPEGWPRPRGFSAGILAQGTRVLSIAGQVGAVPGAGGVAADADFGTQWGQALANLVAVLRAGGGEPAQLTAMRVYVTDIAEFQGAAAAVGEGWGTHLGRVFPAMTLLAVAGLLDPNAQVEIEAEAILP